MHFLKDLALWHFCRIFEKNTQIQDQHMAFLFRANGYDAACVVITDITKLVSKQGYAAHRVIVYVG